MYLTPFSQIFSCLFLRIVNEQVLHIFIFLVSVPFYIQSFSLTECIVIVGVRKTGGCLCVCVSVCLCVCLSVCLCVCVCVCKRPTA